MGLHGYIDEQLMDDEEVVYRASASWWPVIMRFVPFLIVAIVVCVIAGNVANPGTAALLFFVIIIVGVLFQVPGIVRTLGIDIVVTNKRLHTKEGLIAVKNDRESSLERVDDSDIDFNTFANRLFNFGNIEIRTIGGGDVLKYTDIAHPRELKRAINTARDRLLDDKDARTEF